MENRYLCDTARHVEPHPLRRSEPWPCLLVCAVRDGRRYAARAGTAARRREAVPSQAEGRLLILPGVGNTRFHLAGFVEAAEAQLPRFDVEVRPWGVPFLTIHNLRAHERNIATAARDRRRDRRVAPRASRRAVLPRRLLGRRRHGHARRRRRCPTTSASIGSCSSRLRSRPTIRSQSEVLPHVREFVVNYASERDLQVGWGTRTFGTIDRKCTDSAGAIGFAAAHERLLEYHWSSVDVPLGHAGNHLAYLNRALAGGEAAAGARSVGRRRGSARALGANLQGAVTWPCSCLR